MKSIEAINLVFLFISLYFEVFLLIIYIKHKNELETESALLSDGSNLIYTTVIVPCFNEQKTVSKTIESLLDLDYPKDKLEILVVDDGSTDNTWDEMKKYEKNPQVRIYKKTNGGKHTVLNFGIEKANGEIIGCLDADSFVDKYALKNMMVYFMDTKTMAVTPSIKVYNPKNLLQRMQWSEYTLGILIAKLFSYADAILVVPGPFSMFRKDVFKMVGNYEKAHHTEDMEITLRLHQKNMQIKNSHKSYVYTTTPDTIKSLYKQRLRWNFGFIKNTIDYKEILFNKKHGNYGMLVLPFSLIMMFSTLLILFNAINLIIVYLYRLFVKISVVGIAFKPATVDMFFMNSGASLMIGLLLLLISFFLIITAVKISTGKITIKREIFYFMFLYGLISPIWVISAIYKALLSKQIKWR
jgi:cellulose synthase/poly-beta-1,6-N-acetylglucosamine synthase-like glycosyltransferase